MPTNTPIDLLMAGLQDVVNALKNLDSKSPLQTLHPTHVQHLQQLVELLATPTATSVHPAAPLRVDNTATSTVAAPPPPQTALPTLPSVHTQISLPTPSLRVQFTPDTVLVPKTAVQTYKNVQTVKTATIPVSKVAKRKPKQNLKGPQHIPRHTHGTRNNRRHLAASAIVDNSYIHHALHGNAFNPDTGTIAKYPELSHSSDGAKWIQSNDEEIHRLAQGFGNMHGTDTLFFIYRAALPNGYKPGYVSVVCAYRPEKEQQHRTRWCIGGDKIAYVGDVSTKTAGLETAKLLFNSVISTQNGRFMTGDLKDFYLGTILDMYEYIRIPVSLLSAHIIAHYNLAPLIHKGFVYAEVRKGMYGLPQAGKLANDQLIARLAPFGYHPVPFTAGLWKHDHSDLIFTLVVDDFGVKYTKVQDATALMQTLRNVGYRVTEDWMGNQYVGLTIDWDYVHGTVDLSMPGYIERVLSRFQHESPDRPENSPHPWQKPQFGAKTQYTAPDDSTPYLDTKQTTHVQQVLGVLLYYARAIDSTMLPALGTLAAAQAKPTAATLDAITQLLNYCATYPDATFRFHASDMILWLDGDASYLSVTNARSRAAGYYFLSSNPSSLPDSTSPPTKGAVTVYCQIMKNVVSSAAKAELGALFLNAQTACPLRVALQEMGHEQPATPIQTDNSTASGIINDTVKQKRSKAIDMRFYWIRDRVRQGQFRVYWKERADYFSKHHPAVHHRHMRSAYLHVPQSNNYYDALDPQQNTESPSNDRGEGVLMSQASVRHTTSADSHLWPQPLTAS